MESHLVCGLGACLCDYTPFLCHIYPVAKIGFSFWSDSSSLSPPRKDESSLKFHDKEVGQDPMLDGTPSSSSQATGEAGWTLAQLRSSSHLGGILAVEGRALPLLPVLERGVPIGLHHLQTAPSQDRDLG